MQIIALDLFEKAANAENSLKRTAYTMIAFITMVNNLKLRKKKSFNPMLGETFEVVTDRCKFISEKVSH